MSVYDKLDEELLASMALTILIHITGLTKLADAVMLFACFLYTDLSSHKSL